MNDKELMQGHIQEANVPCDVVTDYKPTDGVCQTCSRRALCAIVAADVEPDQVIAALALLRRVEAGESVEMPKSGMELIDRIAKQTPEKPDYWSSCGQCDRNESDAQDVIEAAAWNKEGAK